MKYRKKPIEVEAIQYTGRNELEVMAWIGKDYKAAFTNHLGFAIHTLEGTMHASPGDWIIRGVKDELYPCKPDIFEASYDPVSE